jgi:CheY-like chemotaxis protein
MTSHGGTITVQSAPGQGTTVTLYFPRLQRGTVAEAGPESALQTGKGCILFVDDEPAIARLGRTMLEPFGYEVVVSTSSTEALTTFQATPHRFDLVITDQTMPKMTGTTLAKVLRQIRPDIPLILCTGFSHLVDAEHANMLGIDAFLLKPLRAVELGATIQRVLEQRSVI